MSLLAAQANSARGGGPRVLERLGRYDLIQRIGSGGMAECFLAVQRGLMGFEKLVAVKKIHKHLAAQETFIEMLLKEARVSAILKHPRIVDIYDLGRAGDTYFVAMEFLPGQPLSKVLPAALRHKRPLNIFDAVRVIADAADALDAAHNMRTMSGDAIELIHRDVSPGNIIILYDGGVKLVDFGIAKACGEVTNVGGPPMLKGKAGYAAPEQIEDRADRRSDIFSLGICMWEALTMKRLFRADDDLATLELVRKGNVPPPSSVRDEVPTEVDRICLRALEVDPDRRYQNARDMRVELENLLWTANYYRASNTLARYMREMFGTAIAEQERLLRAAQSSGAAAPSATVRPADDLAEVEIVEGEAEAEPAAARPGRSLPLPPPSVDTEELPRGKHGGPAALAAAPTPAPIEVEPDGEEMTTTVQDDAPTEVADEAGPTTVAAPPTEAIAEEPADDASAPVTPTGSIAAEMASSGSGTGRTGAVPPRTGRRRLFAAVAGAAALLVVVVALARRDGSGGDDGDAEPRAGTGSPQARRGGDRPAAVPAPGPGTGAEPAVVDDPPAPVADDPPAPAADDPPAPAADDPAAPAADDPGPRPRPPARDRDADRARSHELYSRGVRLFVQGQTGEAKRAFREAIRLDAGNAQAHRGLGLVHERNGATRDAIRELEKYLRLSPDARDAESIRKRIARLRG